jgi:hypothetical protein
MPFIVLSRFFLASGRSTGYVFSFDFSHLNHPMIVAGKGDTESDEDAS